MSLPEDVCAESISTSWSLDRRIYSGIETVLFTACAFGLSWTIGANLETNGLAPLMLVLVVIGALYISYLSPILIHKDSLADRGLGSWRTLFIRTDNLAEAARLYVPWGVAGLVLFVGAALLKDPAIFSRLNWYSVFLKFGLYLCSAIAQDFLFMCFFLMRLKAWFGAQECAAGEDRSMRLRITATTAVLFSLYHFPNLPLMAIALCVGVIAIWIYYATPNLFVLVCCHAVLGTVLHRLVEMHMRVGPFYWKTNGYMFRNMFPFVKPWIGNLF